MRDFQNNKIENQIGNSLLQSIVDNTNAVIYIKDLDGKYILINSQYEKLFNVSKQDVIGKTDYDIFQKEVADSFNENDQTIVETGESLSFEESVRYGYQEYFYISNKFPVYGHQNEIYAICGISTDITEIIRSKNTIHQREHEFNILVSNIQGVVYRCAIDSDWKMYLISDFIYTLSGYPASDFIMNRKRTYASIIHPSDRQMVEDVVNIGLENREAYLITYRIIHRDGTVRWVHEKGVGYYDDNQHSAMYLDGVIIDVTAEKNLEQLLSAKNQELETINKELEERILERTIHLKDSNEQLQSTVERLKETQQQLIESKKMIAIGSLVKGICHEMSTPLSNGLSMSTYITFELEKFVDRVTHSMVTKEEVFEFLSKLETHVNSTIGYISKSIGIADNLRIIAENPMEQKKSTFDLYVYLETVISAMKRNFGKNNITIELTCIKSLMVNSYPGLLYQVVDLLMTNSADHGFESIEERYVQIMIEDHVKTFVMIFRDNGKGVDATVLPKLFDPFYTTKMGSHSGLGLYLVYNIVTQKLGGSIDCESAPGKGLTFRLVIPKNGQL